MSIYVPDALKARMDPLNDRVTWSNVAQEAFERKLASSNLMTGSDMKDVIERLRASKAEFVEQNETLGAKDGLAWAKAHASFSDLRDFSRISVETMATAPIYAVAFNEMMGTDRDEPEEQWFYDSDARAYDENEYVRAYVEAVQGLWHEVAGQL